MLKKFHPAGSPGDPYIEGSAVYVVTRDGDVLEGYHIQQRLFDLVSLDRSPLDGGEKQGFTIEGDTLKPNWCEGRRRLIGAYGKREQAQAIAQRQKDKRKTDK